jgi:putative transposase
MRFAFIAQHRGVWQTRQMCQALEVSRAGFYDWLGRPQSRRARENQVLLVSIRTSFEQSDRTYGSLEYGVMLQPGVIVAVRTGLHD